MLDDYIDIQPIVYKILKNAVSKDKYSHAYLFETNGFYDSYKLILSFVKAIMCPKNKTNNQGCQDCHQCEVINSGNFPEIEIISPDGLWIKKEQLIKLQEEFSKKAIIGNKKIYIIKEAEKLNKQSANSILKFLEEPEEGIIAILITENLYQVLETIRSRCQIISLKEVKKQITVQNTLSALGLVLFENNDLNEVEKEKINKIINFVNYYEKHHLDTIIYMQKLWHDYIKNKDDLLISFDIMILFYKDILNYLMEKPIEIFFDEEKSISDIAKINTITTICQKLSILTEFKDKIKYNANTNLLMDKLIITLERRK